MHGLQQQKNRSADIRLRFHFQGKRRGNPQNHGRHFRVQRMPRNQLLELWSLMPERIKIGTRGSKLALWQANWVKSVLEKKHPSLAVELVIIRTQGDKILDVPLAQVGGKGLFVKEIEEALLDGRIDLAVHSMKDMPADIPDGLCIGPIPRRENPQDVLISSKGLCLADLPVGAYHPHDRPLLFQLLQRIQEFNFLKRPLAWCHVLKAPKVRTHALFLGLGSWTPRRMTQ